MLFKLVVLVYFVELFIVIGVCSKLLWDLVMIFNINRGWVMIGYSLVMIELLMFLY